MCEPGGILWLKKLDGELNQRINYNIPTYK